MKNDIIRRPNPICPQCRKELVFIRANNFLSLEYQCPNCQSHFRLKLVCDAYHSPLKSRRWLLLGG